MPSTLAEIVHANRPAFYGEINPGDHPKFSHRLRALSGPSSSSIARTEPTDVKVADSADFRPHAKGQKFAWQPPSISGMTPLDSTSASYDSMTMTASTSVTAGAVKAVGVQSSVPPPKHGTKKESPPPSWAAKMSEAHINACNTVAQSATTIVGVIERYLGRLEDHRQSSFAPQRIQAYYHGDRLNQGRNLSVVERGYSGDRRQHHDSHFRNRSRSRSPPRHQRTEQLHSLTEDNSMNRDGRRSPIRSGPQQRTEQYSLTEDNSMDHGRRRSLPRLSRQQYNGTEASSTGGGSASMSNTF